MTSFIFIRKEHHGLCTRNVQNRLWGRDSRVTFLVMNLLVCTLKKVCFRRRKAQIDSVILARWPGIYYVASIHKSAEHASQYRTEILSAYGFKCAVTGCTLMPALLSVAHIKTIYDDRYLDLTYGVVLRSAYPPSVLKRLFDVLLHDTDGSVKVADFKEYEVKPWSEYSGLDGKKLSLPRIKTIGLILNT